MNALIEEVLRYAGMGRADEKEIDPRIIEFADRAVEELIHVYEPRCTTKIFSVNAIRGVENGLRFGGVNVMDVTSKSLTVNLQGCEEVLFFAATLGAEVDWLIRKYSAKDISQGLIMDAAATALIESYCDGCNYRLEKELNKDYKTLRPRFSPGYGDFDVKHQWDFIRLLDLPRTIGVTPTDSGMLVPTKSVTALMGISRFKKPLYGDIQRCNIHGCEECLKKDCIYRRNV